MCDEYFQFYNRASSISQNRVISKYTWKAHTLGWWFSFRVWILAEKKYFYAIIICGFFLRSFPIRREHVHVWNFWTLKCSSRHVECIFDNLYERIPPKVGFFFAQTQKFFMNYITFSKNKLHRKVLLDRLNTVSTTLMNFFRHKSKIFRSMSKKNWKLIFFFQKRFFCENSKCCSGYVECSFGNPAQNLWHKVLIKFLSFRNF